MFIAKQGKIYLLRRKFDKNQKPKKESIAVSIANYLRNAMINGHFKPGDKLKEKEICDELGVSRTPLREAFRILQSEGLLSYNSHQGVIVTPVTLKDIENIWEVRYSLEVMGAERAIEKMTDEDLQKLQAIETRLESLQPNDKKNIMKTNADFHMNIMRIADNDKLEKIIREIWVQISVIQSISLFKEGRLHTSCIEHKKILEAFESKDKKLVKKCMKEHLAKGKENLILGMQLKK